MEDSRRMTFGLDFNTGEAADKLDIMLNQLDAATQQAKETEEAGRSAGLGIQAGADLGGIGAERLGTALSNIQDSAQDAQTGLSDIGTSAQEMAGRFGTAGETTSAVFGTMETEAESFSQAVARSMGSALQEGKSFSGAFKAGVQEAFLQGEKRIAAFEKKAKGIGTAVLHPIKTIREKLGKALKDIGTKTKKTGEEAEEAKGQFEQLGNEGSNALNGLKDSIKGAIGAFVGIEAIKAGVEHLKSFIGTAINAAMEAENLSAKFDAVFSGSDVGAWAENFSSAVHRSKIEVKDFLVQNKAMYREMGVTGEAANKLSKVTTSLAYDLGSAFSMSDSDALSLMQDYIRGNTAALAEYGIQIDDAALKASALSMGLGSQIDSLDDTAMAQVRLNALLSESSQIQQAAIQNTGGLTNSVKSLSGIWSGFLAKAGAKFAPALERIFSAVIDRWPVIEPMLLGLVDVLGNGLEQSFPILMELGQTLLPVLITVLGTTFESAAPLLSVFGELAQTVLPPAAEMIGLLAKTVLPPLVDILGTLNTAVIQPLVPVVEHIVGALLPPLGELLEAISPILTGLSHVLGVIGDILIGIADVLGSIISWMSGGAGKIGSFFGAFSNGSKQGKESVNDLNFALSELQSTASQRVALSLDTAQYQSGMKTASESATKTILESGLKAEKSNIINFEHIGASASSAYGIVQENAEKTWDAVVQQAEEGADRTIIAFDRITRASVGVGAVSRIGASVPAVRFPHNRNGTDDFPGGWTHINEEGGEVAFLPRGTAIIPADKSKELIQNVDFSHKSGEIVFNISAPITVRIQGSSEQNTADQIETQLEEKVREMFERLLEEEYSQRLMQMGIA